MFEKARAITNARLGMKNKKSSNTKSYYNTEQETNKKKSAKEPENEKDVIILTDDNFDSTIFNDENMWLVAFYAP